eukprot:GHVR01035555.1.p1 GENE.GHVR01035555.1~~GHVR01035555.1.p1  ORF type:complete len:131 (+),score=31.97 GHVR01035555.1:107-499(+)
MIPLGPQLKDHNYSLSDPDEKENSCDESVRRSKKRIPPWAEVNELHRQLKEQDNVDPSSIFALGCYVPRLNEMFPPELYVRLGRQPPAPRPRRSSHQWDGQKLCEKELREFRSIMGHTNSWERLVWKDVV